MAPWTPPVAGDIVWCHFPELPRRAPGPKPRPALVVSVVEREDGASVMVAYGTSQKITSLYAGQFAITKHVHPTSYKNAGLSYDTKFDLRQLVELPWTEDFFAVAPGTPSGQHPKLGSLDAAMMKSVQAAYRAARHRA